MITCPKCGKPTKANDQFCQFCGAKIKNRKSVKKWIKYSVALVILVIVCFLANYYLISQVAVVVSFNPDVRENAALQILAPYKNGIELRTPKEYDYNFFSIFNGFNLHGIEFSTCRVCGYVIKSRLAAEQGVHNIVIVEHPPTSQEDRVFLKAMQGIPPKIPK